MISSKVISTSATKLLFIGKSGVKCCLKQGWQMWAILELTKTKRRNVKLQQLWNLQTWSDKFTLCVFDKYTLQKNKSPNLKWQIHTLCILQINTAKKHIPNLKWQIKKLNLKFTFLLLVWPCLESRTRAASTAIQGFLSSCMIYIILLSISYVLYYV